MTGYTPGPWEIKNNGKDIFGPLGGDSGDGVKADPTDGWHIAEIQRTPTFSELGEVELGAPREANAHLIAAAPDLLEALEEAVFWNGIDDEGVSAVWRDKAEAAIAKAEGKK